MLYFTSSREIPKEQKRHADQMTRSPVASLSPLPLSRTAVGPCTACPANSVNPELGSTLITECICAAGASGEILGEGEGSCDLCELNFYKTEIGAAPVM